MKGFHINELDKLTTLAQNVNKFYEKQLLAMPHHLFFVTKVCPPKIPNKICLNHNDSMTRSGKTPADDQKDQGNDKGIKKINTDF